MFTSRAREHIYYGVHFQNQRLLTEFLYYLANTTELLPCRDIQEVVTM